MFFSELYNSVGGGVGMEKFTRVIKLWKFYLSALELYIFSGGLAVVDLNLQMILRVLVAVATFKCKIIVTRADTLHKLRINRKSLNFNQICSRKSFPAKVSSDITRQAERRF